MYNKVECYKKGVPDYEFNSNTFARQYCFPMTFSERVFFVFQVANSTVERSSDPERDPRVESAQHHDAEGRASRCDSQSHGGGPETLRLRRPLRG